MWGGKKFKKESWEWFNSALPHKKKATSYVSKTTLAEMGDSNKINQVQLKRIPGKVKVPKTKEPAAKKRGLKPVQKDQGTAHRGLLSHQMYSSARSEDEEEMGVSILR